MKKFKLMLILLLVFASLPVQSALASGSIIVTDIPANMPTVPTPTPQVTTNLTATSMYNYSGGLLDEKKLSIYPQLTEYITQLTDNNENTTAPMEKWQQLVYVFPEEVTINGAIAKFISEGTGELLAIYYDSKNVSITSTTLVSGNRIKAALGKGEVTGVKKVILYAKGTDSKEVDFKVTVSEFNVYGFGKDPTPQPTPTPTPEQPTGDQALLTITLLNGIEKQYDLPMNEVNAFLTWYDARDAGRGPGMYAIDKHSNNKGPFKKRKDYVVFDKILTYEVSEYTAAK
ncbi:hypothetical protein NSS79_18990 [Paenibacillus sp. FSL L8-0436]|uniref:hypothetical protein n=1 Tax=Paenibacillus sp. FSL L8-0436 TaxID=2954686 RepID=UPI0031583545